MTQLKFAFIISLLFISISMQAQKEVGLHFMKNVWQTTRTNPALVPNEKFILFLPSVRNNLLITGATYNDFIAQKEGNKTIVDIDQVIDKLEPENLIRDDLDIETIGAAYKVGLVTLSVGHAFRYNAFLNYPKTLPQVIWQGNGQFVGETVNLANDFQLTGYNEFAIGAAVKVKGLTLGAKAKYLTGIADVSTDLNHRDISLFTSDDIYQLQLNADYQINSSGAFDYTDFDNFDFNFNFGQIGADILLTENTGFAFDIGAHYVVGNFEFAASVIDLSSGIEWTKEAKSYTTSGTFKYDGLDFSDALTDESVNFEDALDTLDQIFEIVETSGKYMTEIPAKLYLSTHYNWNNWRFSGMYFSETMREHTFNAIGLGASYKLLEMLTVGGTYTALPERDSYANFGLNAVGQLGPIQVFASTDNIGAVFQPGNSHRFSARVGINLIW